MSNETMQEREAWVLRWFENRFRAGDVFHDGSEALTLDGAMQLVADAQAAERERCARLVEQAIDAKVPEIEDEALRQAARRIRES
jgi:hypothetical protein